MNIEISRREAILGISTSLLPLTFLRCSGLTPKSLEHNTSSNAFFELIQPIIETAKKRRLVRKENSPQIDWDLNEDRINLLLFSWGETHEPPLLEKADIGSHTIVSLDNKEQDTDIISFTHDIRAPEIERYLADKNQHDGKAVKIDQAYGVGGFELMRKTMENATGLLVDLQIAFPDSVVTKIVDQAFSKIQVKNPKSFTAYPIYFSGIKYPELYFPEGLLEMDGVRTLQYIKAVPVVDQDPTLEHNQRKQRVLESLMVRTKSPRLLGQLLLLLKDEFNKGSIQSDVNLSHYLLSSVNYKTITAAMRLLFNKGITEQAASLVGKKIYLVDPAHGDGGVQWVNANVAHNPITKAELEQVYLPDVGYEVPFDFRLGFAANPYAEDLVNGYWLPTRYRLKELLTI